VRDATESGVDANHKSNARKMTDVPQAKKRKVASQIVAIKNPDKDFHESWKPRMVNGKRMIRHPMNKPHPSRGVLFGPPGTGKTTIVLNMVIRQDPPFETIYVIHIDGKFTKEYNKLVNFTKLPSIPDPDWWSGETKTLVVLDDLEYKFMSKSQKANLDRLFGYVSTHKNISVILTAQEGFNVPTCARRCADLWVLWQGRDMDAMQQLARKGGLKKIDLDAIYHAFDFDLRDSLWLDTTPYSPYPIAINGTEVITQDEMEELRDRYNAHLKQKKRYLKTLAEEGDEDKNKPKKRQQNSVDQKDENVL